MITLILIALGATAVAFGLAYVIIKYLPLKFRWIASLALLILAGFLVFKIYDGLIKIGNQYFGCLNISSAFQSYVKYL